MTDWNGAGGVWKGYGPSWATFGITGDYVALPPAWRETGNDTLGANILWYSPVALSEALTIDRIATKIEALAAGGLLRIGFYTNVSGRPGTLLVDSGALDASAIAEVEGTVAVTLPAAQLWLAMLCNDAAIAVPTANTGKTVAWTTAVLSRQGLSLSVAQAYGVLPASATAPTTVQYRTLLASVRLA